MHTSASDGRHLECDFCLCRKLLGVSLVECPTPKKRFFNFELRYSRVWGLSVKICILPVLVAAILVYRLPVARDTVRNLSALISLTQKNELRIKHFGLMCYTSEDNRISVLVHFEAAIYISWNSGFQPGCQWRSQGVLVEGSIESPPLHHAPKCFTRREKNKQ